MSDFLVQYINEIKSGHILVGQDLKQELKNLEQDLQSEEYIYNTADAELRIDFIENCVRLTKSPYYNKPMKLMLWQKAFIETLYSFKMADNGLKRFKRAILEVGRKNGKSELCGALGLAEFWLGQKGADIVCSSNDDAQAAIIYDSIDLMRMLIDPEQLDSKRNQRFILNKLTNTKIFKLSDRTRNKEGRNIDLAFLDESHEMKNNVIAKSIEQSQSLKEEPLFINITTEGFINDGYLDQELEKARKVIYGEDDTQAGKRLLPWLYTQDSEQEVWQNERSWQKSNPTVGVIKRTDYLSEQLDIARNSRADRVFVLCKDFNLKQSSSTAWLDADTFVYDAKFDIEEFRGAYCLGAVDMSETTDLTCAKILLMKPNDNTKYVFTRYFIPQTKLEENDDRLAGAKYKEWASQGLITVSEGADIDLSVVADWFYWLYEEYDIRLFKCGYDQRFSKDFINRMNFYGWSKGDALIMILQNANTLSNAIKLLEQDLKHRLVNYDENEVDRWCLGNAAIKVNERNEALIVKQQTKKRIDGAVALAILYETYRQYRPEFRALIEGGSNGDF